MGGVAGGSARAGRRRAPVLAAFAVTVLLAASVSLVGAPSAGAEGDPMDPAIGGSFVASDPERVLDTRRDGDGTCVRGERVAPMPTVPAEAGAVVLNVTVLGASSSGFVSLYAAGTARPGTSSLNFSPGPPVANAVTTRIGVGGVAVYAAGGCPHVLIDLVGHYVGGAPARGGSFGSLEPSRPVDTRRDGEGPCVKGERVFALEDLPAGSQGIVANVTVTGASSPGFLSVYPAGGPRPATSTLNFAARTAVANGVTTAVGPAGLAVYASGGCPHVVIDLVGHFTGDSAVLEGSFVGSAPDRVLNTRRDDQGPCLQGERLVDLPRVPADAVAVTLNVTVTQSSGPGLVSVFADGSTRPGTSTLNFAKGQTIANAATVAVGPGGVRVRASGGCPHVILDLVGHYSGAPAPLTGVVQVAPGGVHTCALLGDGTVRCWGADGSPDGYPGQLGDGRGESSAFPVPVEGIDDAVHVATGLLTSCAVHADTTVSCWGVDVADPGLEAATLVPAPVPGLSGVEQLVVGQFAACGLLADGTVSCWGTRWFNGRHQEHLSVPAPVPGLSDVVELSGSDGHTCARHVDRTVSCWGANFDYAGPEPHDPSAPTHVKIDDIDDAVAISSGGMTACAVRADASVWCWGETARLLDHDGPSGPWHDDPVEIPLLRASTSVGVAWDSACGMDEHGQITCIGKGPLVSRGLDPEPAAPVVIPIVEEVEDIASGAWNACALLEDSTVRCWGWNVGGMLGIGSLDFPPAPLPVIAGIPPEAT